MPSISPADFGCVAASRAASSPPDTKVAALATPVASRSRYSAASPVTAPCAASSSAAPAQPASSTARASKRASQRGASSAPTR
jgi:hypothetical protein